MRRGWKWIGMRQNVRIVFFSRWISGCIRLSTVLYTVFSKQCGVSYGSLDMLRAFSNVSIKYNKLCFREISFNSLEKNASLTQSDWQALFISVNKMISYESVQLSKQVYPIYQILIVSCSVIYLSSTRLAK